MKRRTLIVSVRFRKSRSVVIAEQYLIRAWIHQSEEIRNALYTCEGGPPSKTRYSISRTRLPSPSECLCVKHESRQRSLTSTCSILARVCIYAARLYGVDGYIHCPSHILQNQRANVLTGDSFSGHIIHIQAGTARIS